MIYGPGLSQRGIGFGGYGDGNFSVSREPGPLATLVIFTDWAVPPPADASP